MMEFDKYPLQSSPVVCHVQQVAHQFSNTPILLNLSQQEQSVQQYLYGPIDIEMPQDKIEAVMNIKNNVSYAQVFSEKDTNKRRKRGYDLGYSDNKSEMNHENASKRIRRN